MSIPMADLRAQYQALEPEINSALREVLQSGRFILGQNVSALEAEVAEFCGAKYGIAVASGTDAITISLASLGIGPGDEVITTPFTFIATSEAIALVGAKPVYADIDPSTYNLDPDKIRALITPKTRAILPVHLYGHCARMDEILSIATEHGLSVVADAAQAIGAQYRGRRIGEMGDAVTLSFYPTKNLGGCGDGGMILTNDERVAENAISYRFHGRSGPDVYPRVGYCSRLDEMQAALLRVKLPHLEQWNKTRREHAALYSQALLGTSITAPVEEAGSSHIYHQYTVRAANRDAAREALRQTGVDTAVFYTVPCHLQPAYSALGFKEGDLPEAERASREVFSVPVHPELSAEDVRTVAGALATAASRS